jgi:Asp-tRNA(Asn)/Glu-tRNA(Gln) amidotransferase A subunit family amidase
MKRREIAFWAFLLAAVQLAAASAPPDSIDQTVIRSAEILQGLSFTPAERDSMLEGLKGQLAYLEKIRAFKLERSVVPAVIFNPIPTGFSFPAGKEFVKVAQPKGIKRPAAEADLAYLPIPALAELLRTRQITSEELTRFYLGRLKKYDPILHCVITLTEARALREARRADDEIRAGNYRGLLHGIPYAVKDLLSTADYKTTWGSVPFKEQMIPEDATVIKKLEAAGAVLVAKTTMGELAWGDVWFGGMTRNPWNPEEGSSGSSAGSASAVSAGLVPFAIGTETWGSIVSPATVCGVSGLRPTYGRVSRSGAMALSWSMDKIGALCRTAEDAAIVLAAIHGPDQVDQTLYDVPFRYEANIPLAGLRIGCLCKDFAADYPFHKNDSLALAQLTFLGAHLVPLVLPDLPVDALSIILSAEAAAAFDDLTRSNRDSLMVRQIKNAWPNDFRQSRFIPAVEYINANRIRHELIRRMAEIMQKVDCYIAPSDEGDNLLLTNLTGHPSITVPDGFAADGTPTSITIVGRLFDEGTIIAVANKYQQASGHHLKRPPLAAGTK